MRPCCCHASWRFVPLRSYTGFLSLKAFCDPILHYLWPRAVGFFTPSLLQIPAVLLFSLVSASKPAASLSGALCCNTLPNSASNHPHTQRDSADTCSAASVTSDDSLPECLASVSHAGPASQPPPAAQPVPHSVIAVLVR